MSKRFGRNQKRKLIERHKAENDMVHEWTNNQINEANRRHREAERQREMMARELADCLERSLKPRVTVHSDHARRGFGVTATIEDSTMVVINSQDISIEAMYMLKGEYAREAMAITLAKQFVKCMQQGEGTRMRR